jgi:hypothetical protein
MRRCLGLAALLAACNGADRAEPARTAEPVEDEPPSAPAAPAAPADAALTVSPVVGGCPSALVVDGETASIARVPVASGRAAACLAGEDAPDRGPVVSERVDVLEAGRAGCDRAERFTFRHEGLTVRTRCPASGRLVVEAEAVRGTRTLAALDDLPEAVVAHVPWAGDWDGDGRPEWLVEVVAAGEIRYLGAFALDADDRVVTLAEHRG